MIVCFGSFASIIAVRCFMNFPLAAGIPLRYANGLELQRPGSIVRTQ